MSSSRSTAPLVDSHCHLDLAPFDEDRAEVLARARAAGVQAIVVPGIDLAQCRRALALAESQPGAAHPELAIALGIHPNSSDGWTPDAAAEFAALARSPKVVAYGEIGLDYYWDKSPKPDQFAAFEAQLELAAELNLPVIIHNREASEDVIRILESWADGLSGTLREAPGVLHSVSAPAELVERALAAGFYIGFTGPITYKNADQTRRIAAAAPLERILVETDGPFLTPVPHRGKRNEPAYIPLIVERLASVRQMPLAQIAEATTVNAERLFRFT